VQVVLVYFLAISA